MKCKRCLNSIIQGQEHTKELQCIKCGARYFLIKGKWLSKYGKIIIENNPIFPKRKK